MSSDKKTKTQKSDSLEIEDKIENIESAKALKNVIQLFIGIFQLVIFSMIVTVWIFKYNDTTTIILISLFHMIPLFFSFVYSVFVIPLSYRAWLIPKGKMKTPQIRKGKLVLLIYFFVLITVIMGIVADTIWRIIIFQSACNLLVPNNNCNDEDYFKIMWLFFSLNIASFVICIIGLILSAIFRSHMTYALRFRRKNMFEADGSGM